MATNLWVTKWQSLRNGMEWLGLRWGQIRRRSSRVTPFLNAWSFHMAESMGIRAFAALAPGSVMHLFTSRLDSLLPGHSARSTWPHLLRELFPSLLSSLLFSYLFFPFHLFLFLFFSCSGTPSSEEFFHGLLHNFGSGNGMCSFAILVVAIDICMHVNYFLLLCRQLLWILVDFFCFLFFIFFVFFVFVFPLNMSPKISLNIFVGKINK